MKYWGKTGAFWGGFWGLLFGFRVLCDTGIIGPVLAAGPGRGVDCERDGRGRPWWEA